MEFRQTSLLQSVKCVAKVRRGLASTCIDQPTDLDMVVWDGLESFGWFHRASDDF